MRHMRARTHSVLVGLVVGTIAALASLGATGCVVASEQEPTTQTQSSSDLTKTAPNARPILDLADESPDPMRTAPPAATNAAINALTHGDKSAPKPLIGPPAGTDHGPGPHPWKPPSGDEADNGGNGYGPSGAAVDTSGSGGSGGTSDNKK